MLRKTYKLTLSVLACAAVVGCAVSKVEPLTVPLVYKVDRSNAGKLGTLSCSAISQVQVSDARTDKTLGLRTHESKPLKADVTAGGDPTAWVRDGVQGLLAENGVSFQGGGPKLAVSIDTLHTTESIWHRASYGADVALSGQLLATSGQACWKGTGGGSSSDYGYAGSIEDYQETLNEALDRATLQMTQSQGFKEALCHCGN